MKRSNSFLISHAFENKACAVKQNHHIQQTVQYNISIVALNNGFTELCFLESLFINPIRPGKGGGGEVPAPISTFKNFRDI